MNYLENICIKNTYPKHTSDEENHFETFL